MSLNDAKTFAKNVWGVGASRQFKLISWGVAFAAFGGWYYYDNFVKPPYADYIQEKNKIRLAEAQKKA